MVTGLRFAVWVTCTAPGTLALYLVREIRSYNLSGHLEKSYQQLTSYLVSLRIEILQSESGHLGKHEPLEHQRESDFASFTGNFHVAKDSYGITTCSFLLARTMAYPALCE